MSEENFQKHRERIAATAARDDHEVDRAWRRKVVRGLFGKLYETGLPRIAIDAYLARPEEAHRRAEEAGIVAALRQPPHMFSLIYENVTDVHPLIVTAMWNQIWSRGSAEFVNAYSYVQGLWAQRGGDRAEFLEKYQRAGLVVLGSVQHIRHEGQRAEIESLMEGRMAEGRKTIVTAHQAAARFMGRHIGHGVSATLAAARNGYLVETT